MESIVVACITGVVTLVGVILSNLRSRAVMELAICQAPSSPTTCAMSIVRTAFDLRA